MSCIDSPGRKGYSGERTIIGQQVATEVEPVVPLGHWHDGASSRAVW